MSRPPYIADKNMFKAVSFVKMMVSKGEPIALAIYKSAKYYQVDQKELATLLPGHGVETKNVPLKEA